MLYFCCTSIQNQRIEWIFNAVTVSPRPKANLQRESQAGEKNTGHKKDGGGNGDLVSDGREKHVVDDVISCLTARIVLAGHDLTDSPSKFSVQC